MPITPQRIVSLLSSATEILFAIGVGDRVVGIGHECDFPAMALDRPRVTRSFVDSSRDSNDIDQQVRERWQAGLPLYEVDAALLESLAPDLIVTQAQCDVCAVRYEDVEAIVARSPRLSHTRLVALAPNSLDDILEDVLRVGEAAGVSDSAQQYVDRLRARIGDVQQRTAGLPKPRTLCIEWIEPLMLAANWTPQLVSLAGGEPGLVQPLAHSTYADWEQIVQYDPEVLIISPCGFDLPRSLEEAASLWQRKGFRELNAVREGRTFVVDGNAYLNRSGPRIIDSLEILASLIHPEVFGPCQHPGWARFSA